MELREIADINKASMRERREALRLGTDLLLVASNEGLAEGNFRRRWHRFRKLQ
ncbi:hypothetical protein [Zoogloea sp.]|uniref:hypothetical protein n=1 Tax=Zoogloea sp. TaxID=49181 RepID=UPI001AD1DC87|nr:hypothetical protein [Zoogloea sp.]MBN8285452.1 hypothetical protein [Zoogloea sp.]